MYAACGTLCEMWLSSHYFGDGTSFELEVEPLSLRRRNTRMVMLFRATHGLCCAAGCLCRPIRNTRSSRVRHSSGYLAVLTLTKTHFFPRTVADWNSLSEFFVPGRLLMLPWRLVFWSAQPPGCCWFQSAWHTISNGGDPWPHSTEKWRTEDWRGHSAWKHILVAPNLQCDSSQTSETCTSLDRSWVCDVIIPNRGSVTSICFNWRNALPCLSSSKRNSCFFVNSSHRSTITTRKCGKHFPNTLQSQPAAWRRDDRWVAFWRWPSRCVHPLYPSLVSSNALKIVDTFPLLQHILIKCRFHSRQLPSSDKDCAMISWSFLIVPPHPKFKISSAMQATPFSRPMFHSSSHENFMTRAQTESESCPSIATERCLNVVNAWTPCTVSNAKIR